MKISSKENKIIFLGIPIIFIIGSIMHFAYDLSGHLPIIGLIAPVNESIWEHLKLSFFPTFFWWIITYGILKNNYNFKGKEWILSGIVSSIVSTIFIVTFYYTYTGAFGIHSLFLDIFSLLLAIIIGQILAHHIYKYKKFNVFSASSLYLLFLIYIFMFFVFTFNPPHKPLFLDNQTNSYGIYKEAIK